MNKSILFVYLELFTIRYNLSHRETRVTIPAREFICKRIKKYDDYQDFKLRLYSDSVMMNPQEFFVVREFINYLNGIDKYLKIWYVSYCLT